MAAAEHDDGIIRRVEEFPDVSLFSYRMECPALRIPAKETANLRRRLSHQLLRIPKIKTIYEDAENPEAFRLLVLADMKALEDPNVESTLEEMNKEQNGSPPTISVTSHVIEVSYDFLSVDEALRKILKDKVQEIPTAFEIVGNIAHLNLRDDCLPYKYWIGKVILDKNQPRIRTVVNKLGSINNQYRTFGMEVIAGFQGNDWSVVNVKEEKCSFQLDFQRVYWNSRLAGEHKRLVQLIVANAKKRRGDGKDTVVADVMAGVGPFAVPLTAHENTNNIIVHANDLNPMCFSYLRVNSSRNKCRALSLYNDDGRTFIHNLMRQLKNNDINEVSHYIMNLPASAPEFLDAFRGYPFPTVNQNKAEIDQDSMASPGRPWIHTHCFAPKTAEKEDYQCAIDRCSKALGCQLNRNQDNVKIHVVRDVSPSQNMLCVSFQLPLSVGSLSQIQLGTDDSTTEEVQRPAKRSKARSG